MKSTKSLARGIKRLRRARGMTQAELAEAADISVQFISALEQENRTPSLETIDALCDALEVRPSDLFAAGEGTKRKVSVADKAIEMLQGLPRRDQELALRVLQEALKLRKRR